MSWLHIHMSTLYIHEMDMRKGRKFLHLALDHLSKPWIEENYVHPSTAATANRYGLLFFILPATIEQ